MTLRTRTTLACALIISVAALQSTAFAQATDVDCAKCVDQSDLGQKSVTTGKLANGAVKENTLADKSVTSAKIKGSAVTQGKIRDDAVTAAKLRDGAVTPEKATAEFSNALDTYCMPGQIVVGIDDDGNLACEIPSQPAASCAELEFDGVVWDAPAAGFDLRTRTDSTLHFIGCNGNGCEVDSFYCDYDQDAGTLAFGSTSDGFALRALIDPDNSARGDMSGGEDPLCCTANLPGGYCTAPVEAEDVTALCNSLGYAQGQVVRTTTGNSCPKAKAGNGEDYQEWSSDFVFYDGSAMEYLCSN
jgi:hypothetical protein